MRFSHIVSEFVRDLCDFHVIHASVVVLCHRYGDSMLAFLDLHFFTIGEHRSALVCKICT